MSIKAILIAILFASVLFINTVNNTIREEESQRKIIEESQQRRKDIDENVKNILQIEENRRKRNKVIDSLNYENVGGTPQILEGSELWKSHHNNIQKANNGKINAKLENGWHTVEGVE